MRVYSTDNGWGLFKDESGEARGQARKYRRTYTWNSRNQLISSVDSNYSTSYVYGQDGQRSNKYTQGSETLYFNKMWTLHTDNGNSVYGGQYAKNVYLGETRIVTKLARADQKTAHEEMYKQYYYHSDHLGSATMISDWEGKEYQRIEYTPYGETWVEKTNNSGSEFLPYKFTGKEVDQETGLYYYGARYLDPKYSMWISTDPALGEYIPEMGKGNAKDSGSLPGMGGVYNHINFHLYHYAGNNPVKFVDSDGRSSWEFNILKNWFSDTYNFAPPTQSDIISDVMSPYKETCLMIYDNLEKGIVVGMRFMADYGPYFSLVCYATGQIQLALVIDGISIYCDVTLAVDDYMNSDRTTEDSVILMTDLLSTAISTLASGRMAKGLTNGIYKLGQQEFHKKLTNMISNVIASEFDNIVDSCIKEIKE